MKIVLVSTFETFGGAAIACYRLFKALDKQAGIEAKLLVHQKDDPEPHIQGWATSYWEKKWAFLRFAGERLTFYPYEESKAVRFAYSPATTGVDISQHPWIKEADIINLHWVNFGFLSIRSIQKLAKLGKPIVWTMQDMWAYTGGCHYTKGCEHFQKDCGNCLFLKRPSEKDLSYRILKKKKRLFPKNMTMIGSSVWMANMAQKSSLIQENPHITAQSIPIPIDTEVYSFGNKKEAQKKLGIDSNAFLVLFGAVKLSDERKGMAYFLKALEHLKQLISPLQIPIELLIFGKSDEQLLEQLPYKTHYLGILKGDQALGQAYRAGHVFVLPSLEDNLPNMVLESLASGTPVVAFNQGGIPDMVEHQKQGYLATHKSSEDLAQGIFWVAERFNDQGTKQVPSYKQLCTQARQKILDEFSEEVVSKQYIQLYQDILQS